VKLVHLVGLITKKWINRVHKRTSLTKSAIEEGWPSLQHHIWQLYKYTLYLSNFIYLHIFNLLSTL